MRHYLALIFSLAPLLVVSFSQAATSQTYRFSECVQPAKKGDEPSCRDYTVTVTDSRAHAEIIGHGSEEHTDCRFDATVLSGGGLQPDNTDHCDIAAPNEVALTLTRSTKTLHSGSVQFLTGEKLRAR